MKTINDEIRAVVDEVTEYMQSYERDAQDSIMEGIYMSIETLRFLLDNDADRTRILSEIKHLTEQVNTFRNLNEGHSLT
jgi:hypothetical protein